MQRKHLLLIIFIIGFILLGIGLFINFFNITRAKENSQIMPIYLITAIIVFISFITGVILTLEQQSKDKDIEILED